MATNNIVVLGYAVTALMCAKFPVGIAIDRSYAVPESQV